MEAMQMPDGGPFESLPLDAVAAYEAASSGGEGAALGHPLTAQLRSLLACALRCSVAPAALHSALEAGGLSAERSPGAASAPGPPRTQAARTSPGE